MPIPPDQIRVYHIVNVDRLASIVRDGRLYSDRRLLGQQKPGTTIGMGKIKQRRFELPVTCHPGDNVGDYVPFYFCPRSVMLYVLHRGNNPELTYTGGQRPIIHLEADMRRVVDRADAAERKWAFSLSNAGAYYAPFRKSLDHLEEINWPAVAATDFRPADVREGKQAEFLVHGSFPFALIERIGVRDARIAQQVADILHEAPHRPAVQIMPAWYF